MGRILAGALALALAGVGLRAEAAPFNGTLEFSIGSLPPLVIAGAGSGTSTTNQLTVPAGVFAGTLTTPVENAVPISALSLNASNLAGSFTNAGGGLGGVMALSGFAKVLGLGGNTLANVPLAFTSGGNITAGIGVGGSAFGTGIVATILLDDWTTGQAKVTNVITYTYHFATGMVASRTQMIFGTTTRTGFDNRTPGGLGEVQLVTPTRVATTITDPLAVFTTLTLTFVPEPGTLLLVGSGLVALVAVRRQRGI